jgi:hypothetical protein
MTLTELEQLRLILIELTNLVIDFVVNFSD